MEQKKIGIHQPNYLPWLGYFFKIYLSDVFVLHDNVEYTKKSLTKRTLIRKSTQLLEKSYLTIPIKGKSDYTLIKDLEIDYTHRWRAKQRNKIQSVYKKSPYFEEVFNELEGLLNSANESSSLVDFNTKAIELIIRLLGLETPLIKSSEIPVKGTKSNYNIELVQHLNGTAYISGQGAKKYQGELDFSTNGIELVYHDTFNYLTQNPYYQKQGMFLNGLSIIDALFNIGPEAIVNIFERYKIILEEHPLN